MADKTKQISGQKFLEAFALYTLAYQKYEQVMELERGIALALGHDSEFVDHISDAIYGEDGNSVHTFRTQLKYAGYIEQPKRTKKGARKHKVSSGY
jgi:hypothetical protein